MSLIKIKALCLLTRRQYRNCTTACSSILIYESEVYMIEMSYRQDQTVQCPADHFVLYYHKVKRVRLHGFTVLFTGITIVFIIN